MFELKVAGAVLAVAFSVMMGAAAGRELGERKTLLKDFYKGLLMLHQEIDYMKTPLEEAMQKTGTVLGEPFSCFFWETGVQLEKLPGTPFFSVWQEMADWYLGSVSLLKEDRELILQVGRQIGMLEAGEDCGFLKVYEQRTKQLLDEAEQEYGQKAKLYWRLGILGGIFLVVLLI